MLIEIHVDQVYDISDVFMNPHECWLRTLCSFGADKGSDITGIL